MGPGDRWDQESGGTRSQVGPGDRRDQVSGGTRRQVEPGDRWDQETGEMREGPRSKVSAEQRQGSQLDEAEVRTRT